MLLYDAIKQDGYTIPDCPVFEISNINKWCEEAKGWSEWGENELLKISDAVPPFDDTSTCGFKEFFMEFDVIMNPGDEEASDKMLEANGIPNMSRLKFLFPEIDFPKAATKKYGMLFKPIKKDWGWDIQTAAYKSEEHNGASFVLMNQMSVLGPWAPIIGDPCYIGGIRLTNEGIIVDGGTLTYPDVDRSINIAGGHLPFFWAMSFMQMSSKCITKVELQSPRAERRRAEREGQVPLTKFYVLDVHGLGKPSRVGSKGSEDYKRAFGVVRGSRHKYIGPGPEHLLFGKYKGTYLIPAHTAGSKEAGEVKKMYSVSNPI